MFVTIIYFQFYVDQYYGAGKWVQCASGVDNGNHLQAKLFNVLVLAIQFWFGIHNVSNDLGFEPITWFTNFWLDTIS